MHISFDVKVRGGVRTQARGQDQEHKKNPRSRPRTNFPRPTLSRPRTEMLDTKDQGDKAYVLFKKKAFAQKSQIFREILGILKKKSLSAENHKFFVKFQTKEKRS